MKRKNDDLGEQIKRHSSKDVDDDRIELNPENFLPTGSTLLNLACTDMVDGGFPLGRISTLPGASSAGKTTISLHCMAEAAHSPRFDDYELIHDDVEARMDFDIGYLFGRETKERLKAPPLNEFSNTIQNFKANVLHLLNGDKPFIYILDSFDALTSDEELEKEMRKAVAAAKSDEAAQKIAGSYNTEKAKIAGQVLRMVKQGLANTRSAVIIVQQLRQNISAGPFGAKYTTSGGEAPGFYSTVRPFLKKVKTHKEGIVKPGVRTQAAMEKNSVIGKLYTVEFDLYYDMGIDDVGSMVDFLVTEAGWWKKIGRTIDAKELQMQGTRDRLLRMIEENDAEDALRDVVQKAWTDIAEKTRKNRKRRY